MRSHRVLLSLLPVSLPMVVARGDDIHYGVAEPPARPPGTVRIVSYNVENLFDAVDDPALAGELDDAGAAKPEEHLRALAAVIRRLDADVLCLQEVESRAALESFRDTWLVGLGYAHVASLDAGDERGIEQSVLSRHPIDSAGNWPGLELAGRHPGSPDELDERYAHLAGAPLRYHRSPLEVVVRVAGEPLVLFVVHQKSGRDSAYWRDAEAARTSRMVAERLRAESGARIAVLGDFNAEPGDAAVAPFPAAGLVDVLARAGLPHARQFVTHASGRRIDHAFLSPSLAAALAGDAFVLGTPIRAPGADRDTVPLPDGYASDHFPVCFDLRLVGGEE